MHVFLVSYGKIKTPGLRLAADYFIRQASGFYKVTEIELKSEITGESLSLKKNAQQKEYIQLQSWVSKQFKSKPLIIILDEKGTQQSSHKLAEWVQTKRDQGFQNIVFCVGGAYGFSEEARQNAHLTFAFGQQTLSHDLARTVLYEQIYRIFCILNNHPYHHA